MCIINEANIIPSWREGHLRDEYFNGILVDLRTIQY